METLLNTEADVVFDTSSGISLEEQEEILAGINAMSGSNLEASRLTPETKNIEAKKKGFLFPLIVNISAIVFLGLGFILLFYLHSHDEESIRESSATLGLTERMLIQEMRRETNRRLNEKENEINGILSRLSEADAEFRQLQESMESLTDEQKERAAALLLLQDEYRNSLSGLQNEKAQIIEDSRLKEISLRAQAEERAAVLSSTIERSEANLSAAMEELRQLGSEQERGARMESQMNGFYRTVSSQIQNSRLDDAALTLLAMKEFLGSPVFQGIRALESRRQAQLNAIAATETAVAELKAFMESSGDALSPAAFSALEAKYAILEQRASDQERAITALSSQDSDQAKVIQDYLSQINELNERNINQQETLNRRDTEIVSLRTENEGLLDQVQTQSGRANQSEAELEEQIRQKEELQRQYNDLQQRLDTALRLFREE